MGYPPSVHPEPSNSLSLTFSARAVEVARAMLLSRLADRYGIADRNIAIAERKKMPNAVASLLNADRGNMELYAKVTGLISDTAANQVLIVAAPGSNVTLNTPDPASNASGCVLDITPDDDFFR